MIYLYAGLGIAMISGISAMMQIGTNLNNMSPVSDVVVFFIEITTVSLVASLFSSASATENSILVA